MNRLHVALALGAIVALSACSTEPEGDGPEGASPPASAEATSATSSPEPTPTIPPGPVDLTTEEAGERYLGVVCASNFAAIALQEAFAASEGDHLAGGTPDPAPARAAASSAVDASRTLVELVDDDYYTWPAPVDELIVHVRDSVIRDLGTYSAIANAETFSQAYYTEFPAATDEQTSAAQEIRYRLDLPADTTGSCAGYETAATTLLAEMVERDEYLESFDD